MGQRYSFLEAQQFLFVMRIDNVKRHQSRGVLFWGGDGGGEVSGFAKFVKDTCETSAVLTLLMTFKGMQNYFNTFEPEKEC